MMEHSEKKTAAVKARWAGEKANETELIEMCGELDTESCLDILARMRKNTETVAKIVNQKISASDEDAQCETCRKPKEPGRQWRLVRTSRDERTMLPKNTFFCSDACIARANQKKQGGGPAMLSDRGLSGGKAHL